MAGAALPSQCGNYELVQEIGRGASSEVWLGRHVTIDDHLVALKILLAQDDEAVERFEREARIAARLNHPSIARLLDFGFVHPYHYAAYELIDGKPLRSLMNTDRPLEPALALRIFRQAGAALAYAHRQGVIHRDVSPGNILLTDHGSRVVLIDFGIARSGESDLTISGALLGTRGYFAPEALLSPDALSERSDVFSLGVVLYQMLSGRLPWFETALGRRSDRTLEELYPPPATLRELGVTALPADFDRVLQTMLAVDAERRFASMQAALDEVERVLSRSHSTGRLLAAQADARPTAPISEPTQAAAGFRSNGLASGAVERALGADLQRDPLDRAHVRAEQLRDPTAVADLLNRWSAARPLRRRLLGRLARLHQITSRNIYYFSLRAQIEERKPAPPIERPFDGERALPSVGSTVDIWQIPLPAPGARHSNAGRVVLPQTAHQRDCPACAGEGELVCPRCDGVTAPQPLPDDAGLHNAATVALAQLPMPFALHDAHDDAAERDDELPLRQSRGYAAQRRGADDDDGDEDGDPFELPALPTQRTPAERGAAGGLAALLAQQADAVIDNEDDHDEPPFAARQRQRSGSGDVDGDGAHLPLTARFAGFAARRRPTAQDAAAPCRSCDGSGMISCRRCNGSGRIERTEAFVWSRRTLLLHNATDVPALDEAWLARHCRAATIYQAEAAAPRDAWLQIDEVAALFEEIGRELGELRRMISCELVITMIPLSEVTFDLGSDAEQDRYRLAIYGFEQRIPADWRLLDWGRIVLLVLAGVLAVLLAVAWFLR